ncbi:MAG: type II toxin-antitoxin system VapC family toxin [Ignavibacteria bacterium]
MINRGDSIIIDANIIIYAIQKESEQCKNLLLKCAEEEINGILPVHILAEVMHILMISEARDNGWITGSNPAKQLSEKPDRVRQLLRYENLMKDLMSINLNIISLKQEDFLTTMRIQREFGLLTNDALLVAVSERLRVQGIASADKRFGLVSGKILYSPDDITYK